MQADRDAIFGLIEASPGGFNALNDAGMGAMRAWLAEFGEHAVRELARRNEEEDEELARLRGAVGML